MTLQNAVREAHARSETIIEGAFSLYSLPGRADPQGESEEDWWDPKDLHECSPANPCLAPRVWPQLFDVGESQAHPPSQAIALQSVTSQLEVKLV